MSKKVQKSILLVYVLTLVVMIIGATYAYFTVIRVSSVLPESTVKTATTETLFFTVGNPINITANYDNFAEGNNSLVSSSYAEAKLRKDDANVFMEHKYNLLFEITDNDLEYTVSEEPPELLLSIEGPNGKITSIDGLMYKTVVDNMGASYSGFDITTSKGIYYIAKDFPITTIDETIQNWDISVTLINLPESQDNNISKSFFGKVTIEKVI